MSKLGFQKNIGGDKCYAVENKNNAYCYQSENEIGFISICYQPFINPDWTVTAELKSVVFNAIGDLINPESEEYNELFAEEICGRGVDYEHTEGMPILLENSVFYPDLKSATNHFYFALKGKNGDFKVYINGLGRVFVRVFKGVSGCLDIYETIYLN